MLPADIRKLSLPTSRLLLPRLKPLFYLFKVVILPQAVTATALYMLLRYLLKDTELLDAQRNRLGRGETAHPIEEESDVATGLPTIAGSKLLTSAVAPRVHMLPCSHETDIDIIASSADGQLLISVGIDDSICLWRFAGSQAAVGTREALEIPTVTAEDPIVAAAISNDKQWAAVCSASGQVQLWRLPDDGPTTAQDAHHVLEGCSARVTAITFGNPTSILKDPFATGLQSETEELTPPPLLIAYNNGAVSLCRMETDGASVIRSTGLGSRVFFLSSEGLGEDDVRIIIAGHSAVTLYQRTGSTWSGLMLPSDLSPNDRITCVSLSRLQMRDDSTVLIALGHRSGLVEVFDPAGLLITVIGSTQSGEAIRHVEIASPHMSRCTGCGTANTEGFFVMSSSASQVYLDCVLPYTSLFCRCATPRRSASMDEAPKETSSRKGSPSKGSLVVPPSMGRAHPSPSSSPKQPPSLLLPVSNGDFPLSSHGSRRLSSIYREGPDRPPSPNPSATMGNSHPNGSAEHSRNVRDLEVHPLGAVVSASGGGWAVLRDTLLGIRRSSGGIDDSQWQIWAIDLSTPWNGTALIVETADLNTLIRKTPVQPLGEAGVSMRDRRSERLSSLNGRAPFPSLSSSSSIPIHPSLGYVELHPFARRGSATIVAGFGNRLGVISLPEKAMDPNESQISTGPGAGSRTSSRVSHTPPPPRRMGGVLDNADGIGMVKKTS